MAQKAGIPSQNQKNRGKGIFSAMFPSLTAISNFSPIKKTDFISNVFCPTAYFPASV
jgi:hypothetical protein